MKTHIKSLQDNEYFGEWDLPVENNGKLVVKISKIESGIVTGDGNKKSRKTIMFFNGFNKGLVINSTNRKTLVSILGTPYVEDMIGHEIELYREKGIKAFGSVTDGVRISNKLPKPKELPLLDKTNPKFNAAVESVKTGKSTIEMIKKYYKLSNDFENEVKGI